MIWFKISSLFFIGFWLFLLLSSLRKSIPWLKRFQSWALIFFGATVGCLTMGMFGQISGVYVSMDSIVTALCIVVIFIFGSYEDPSNKKIYKTLTWPTIGACCCLAILIGYWGIWPLLHDYWQWLVS